LGAAVLSAQKFIAARRAPEGLCAKHVFHTPFVRWGPYTCRFCGTCIEPTVPHCACGGLLSGMLWLPAGRVQLVADAAPVVAGVVADPPGVLVAGAPAWLWWVELPPLKMTNAIPPSRRASTNMPESITLGLDQGERSSL